MKPVARPYLEIWSWGKRPQGGTPLFAIIRPYMRIYMRNTFFSDVWGWGTMALSHWLQKHAYVDKENDTMVPIHFMTHHTRLFQACIHRALENRCTLVPKWRRYWCSCRKIGTGVRERCIYYPSHISMRNALYIIL
jgi:hypothetical protein